MSNNQYSDSCISFSLDEFPKQISIKTDICSWTITKKKPRLFHVAISVSYDENRFFLPGIVENAVYGTPPDGITFEGPYQIRINDSSAIYSIVSRHKKGIIGAQCRLCIIKESYLIYIEFFSIDYIFCFDNYIPFLSSIKVDIDQVRKKAEQARNKEEIEDINSLPYVQIADGFIEIFDNKVPLVRTFRKNGTKIIVSDSSVLGLEADIDLFCERRKKGEEEKYRKMFPLRGKKCMITNELGDDIDFEHCKKVSIILVHKEQCYSIIIESEDYFNLNDYKNFISCIGMKRKH
ncbi:MAG: hypothetical protein LBL62_07855 [Planctomycetaceae bacterium]|jgi:hypothetical protein|nr:hypothetical protein [Planctomycetaceae bacterium]